MGMKQVKGTGNKRPDPVGKRIKCTTCDTEYIVTDSSQVLLFVAPPGPTNGGRSTWMAMADCANCGNSFSSELY